MWNSWSVILILVATFNARGVGFLRYFQLKQLPNFLLASPILSLAVCSVLHYVRSQPKIFFSLGFRASNGEKRPTASPLSLDRVPESNSSHLKEKSSAKMQGTAFKLKLNRINYLFMCIFLAVMVILVPLIKNNIFIEWCVVDAFGWQPVVNWYHVCTIYACLIFPL